MAAAPSIRRFAQLVDVRNAAVVDDEASVWVRQPDGTMIWQGAHAFVGDFATHTELAAAEAAAEQVSRRGQPSGYASLDAGGLVPSAQMPPLAINDVFTVASQAEMLGLTAQRGDVAVRSDVNETFILATDDPPTLANWKQVLVPASPVQSVNGKVGVVSLTAADVAAETTAGAQAKADAAEAAAVAASETYADGKAATIEAEIVTAPASGKAPRADGAGHIDVGWLADASVPRAKLVDAISPWVPLKNLKAVQVVGRQLPIGSNVLYTVPAGRRALFPGNIVSYVPATNAGSVTWYEAIRIGGADIPYTLSATPIVNAAGTTGSQSSNNQILVLEAGESIVVVTSGNAGLNVDAQGVYEFDATDDRLTMARAMNLAAGDNTLFTVPLGKVAVAFSGGVSLALASLVGAASSVYIVNNTGGGGTYKIYRVAPGGSTADLGSYFGVSGATATALQLSTTGKILVAGESLVVNSSIADAGSHHHAFFTHLLLDA